MDINLDNIAQHLYGKLETRFLDGLEFGDENGEKLTREEDVPKARFFTFPYKINGKTLGTITITLSEKKGVVVQIGGDLANKKHPSVFNFIKELSAFCKPNLINFKIVNLGKNALTKRDYEFQAKRKEDIPMEPVMESKMYGTARISYQDLGEARLVIKHTQPVNLNVAAGRTMHIDSIYVENAQGERFRYPYKHINGARALAEHLKHGGNPYDAIGQHITSLSEELAQLRKFKGYVNRNDTLSEAMSDINNRVSERIEAVKKEVHGLQRTSYYEAFAESFEAGEEQEIPEDIMNDWIDRLTIRTFNEELKTAFPYIFKLVSEADIPVKELNPDDLLAEKSSTEKQARFMAAAAHNPKFAKKVGMDQGVAKEFNKKDKGTKLLSKAMQHKKNKTESLEDYFEAFVEDIGSITGKNRLFDRDPAVRSQAINDPENGLRAIVSRELPAGQEGVTALSALKGLIDTDEFADRVRALQPGSDVRPVLQVYLKDIADDKIHEPLAGDAKAAAEEILGDGSIQWDSKDTIGGEAAPDMGSEETPPADTGAEETPPADTGATGETPPPGAQPAANPASVVPPAPGEAPPTGVAESVHPSFSKLKAKLIRAKEAGANLHTKLDFGHREMTLHDAIRECGLEPSDVGFLHNASHGGTTGEQEVWNSVSGFWDHENKKSTIGATRMITKIIASYKHGEFQHATPADIKKVVDDIREADPPSSVHGIDKMDVEDPLARVKQLSGHKSTVGSEEPREVEIELDANHHSNKMESSELSIIRKLSGL